MVVSCTWHHLTAQPLPVALSLWHLALHLALHLVLSPLHLVPSQALRMHLAPLHLHQAPVMVTAVPFVSRLAAASSALVALWLSMLVTAPVLLMLAASP